MRKNQNQLNKNGKRHGYWEEYHANGKLMLKGDFANGEKSRYWEYYSYSSNGFVKVFQI
tara:strand:- start:354 stop:530 length:177 start_codon:yes stop_codon:yes gene_type:complete